MAVTITVAKKRDKDVTISLLNTDGTAFSLAGSTVKLTIRDRPGGTEIKTYSSNPTSLQGTIEILAPATNGQAKVHFLQTHFASTAIPYGAESIEMSFDVLVTLADLTKVAWLDGSDYIQKFVLKQYITEP